MLQFLIIIMIVAYTEHHVISDHSCTPLSHNSMTTKLGSCGKVFKLKTSFTFQVLNKIAMAACAIRPLLTVALQELTVLCTKC